MFLTTYFAKNKAITNIVMISLLLIGIFVGLQLKRDITPYIEPESLYVRVIYPGASSREIEQNAIIPLERALQNLNTSPNVVANVNDNFAIMFINFVGVADIKDEKQRTIRLLQSAAGVDPKARVYITEEGPSSVPIYYFALYRDTNSTLSPLDFQRAAADIQLELQKVPGLSGVMAGGLLAEEVHILAKPSLIDRLYISLYEIVQSIQNRNLRLSGGFLDFGTETKNLVTDGGFTNAIDIQDVIVRANFENQKIRVRDVADVTEALEKKLFTMEINGGQGIFFGLRMKGGEDIARTTAFIDKHITSLKGRLPQGIKLDVVERRYEAVNSILGTAQSSAWVGILIVFVVLLFFFDVRTSFWTTATIPMTIAFTFICMYFADISINIVSLCAIITALGMLVDHGIVISENIYTHRLAGLSPMEALQKGVREVAMPVLVTVLTTIAAFLPLLSIKGLLGGIIKPIPIIVSAALLLSFMDAVIFLPAHLYHIPRKKLPLGDRPWVLKARQLYAAALKKAMKYRYPVVLFFFTVLASTGFLIQHMFKTFVFMEPIGVGSLYVQLQAERGISFDAMRSNVVDVKALVEKAVPPESRNAVKFMVGDNAIWDFSYVNGRANIGQVSVYLKSDVRNYDELLSRIQTTIEGSGITNRFASVGYETYGLIPKTKSGIVLFFTQKPNDPLSEEYIAAMLESYDYATNIPGVLSPGHTTVQGDSQLAIIFDYEKAARLGVEVRTVAETLRIAAGGLNVSKWQSDSKEIAYVLKLDFENSNVLQTVQNILIPNRYGRLIALKEFSRIEEQATQGDLLRAYGRRMVNIVADIDPKITTPAVVAQNIQDHFNKNLAPKYPAVEIFSAGESNDIESYFGSFKIAFIVAVAVIYLILLFLFKSAVQPFLVLITIPFGIVGAVWAFYFHGQLLSFMSFVGIIGLAGVVVNDAIVMVDFINGVVRGGGPSSNVADLIVEGAEKRFKAVILTTLTTVFGLLPSIYGLKGIADLIIPIATAMAYGLLFATVLTLVFIPCIYLIGIDIRDFLERFRKPASE